MRKFTQEELDSIYNQLRPEEEILWKGKPGLIPNLSILTTLVLCLLSSIIITVLIAIVNPYSFWYQNFFLLGLTILDGFLILYIMWYCIRYVRKMRRIFYVVTNQRLAIFDKESCFFYKRFNTIKVLSLKKSLFKSASIIFDIDILKDQIKEIGFINIEHGDEVYQMIKNRLKHTKIKTQ